MGLSATAAAVLDTVLEGWVNLMQFLRVTLAAEYRPLKLADLTLEEWQSLPAKVDPWGVMRAGITPSLPTLEEYRQRVAAIQQGRSQHEASQAPIDREREANKTWANRVAQHATAAGVPDAVR